MSSVDGITSDVIGCRNCLIKWYVDTLEGLKDKWDVTLQEAKSCKSVWRDCSSSCDLICLKHLVSSANSRALLQWITLGRSFMYKINRRGPRILPWGTPDTTGRRWEWELLIDTNWNRFIWQFLSQNHRWPDMLYTDSFWSKWVWQMVSNGLLISRYVVSSWWWTVNTLDRKINSCCVVDRFCMNSNWAGFIWQETWSKH